MIYEFSRTEALLGEDCISELKNSRVALFGIGGVGGHIAEALVRSGIGSIDFFDGDTVSLTNINRQIVALHSTIGKNKTEVMAERARDINPNVIIECNNTFILPENSHTIDFSVYDYVIDAVDTVTAKVELIRKAKEANVPVISCMGTGNKLDPTMFEIADIKKTSVCPLAKIMRKKLKDMNINGVKVLYSKEDPVKATTSENKGTAGRTAPASIAFVPSVAGLIIAGEVIKDLAIKNN